MYRAFLMVTAALQLLALASVCLSGSPAWQGAAIVLGLVWTAHALADEAQEAEEAD